MHQITAASKIARLTLNVDDVIVQVVGQQRLWQLTKETLQNRRRNMNVTELVEIDRSAWIHAENYQFKMLYWKPCDTSEAAFCGLVDWV